MIEDESAGLAKLECDTIQLCLLVVEAKQGDHGVRDIFTSEGALGSVDINDDIKK